MTNDELNHLRSLAADIQVKKAEGQKYVLMLGNGASMGAGIMSAPAVMKAILEKRKIEVNPDVYAEQFDELWTQLSPDDRGLYLDEFLTVPLSPGYKTLAKLIEEEYIDVILTFNFDTLVEDALREQKIEAKVLIHEETEDNLIQKLLDGREPRVKVFKLHGGRGSADFKFTTQEMLEYPEPIHTIVRNITGRNIIVCGYGFQDNCVIKAFATTGGYVVCVNPGGVPTPLRGYLTNRRSQQWSFKATFDEFFDKLHEELHPAPARQLPNKPLANPFKFLESYEYTDKESLFERGEVKDGFLQLLQRDKPQVVLLLGPPQAGKTSLVKAGLMPLLDEATYRQFYWRCSRREAPPTASEELIKTRLVRPGVPFGDTLKSLADDDPARHTIVYFDQFERIRDQLLRVIEEDLAVPRTQTEKQKELNKRLAEYLKTNIFDVLGPRLTVVLVMNDELGLSILALSQMQGVKPSVLVCPELDPDQVVNIVRALTQKAEIEFDEKIINEMAELYSNKKFTLAHVQAVCYLVARASHVSYASYQSFKDRDVLDKAINACNFITFVEDFSFPDSVWLRNILKVPLKVDKQDIAKFITDHLDELLPSATVMAGDK
jgi:SIR2-like domain